ncbi:MAG: adenylate kinase [Oscillospiraceae bacterium]|nr:adenylate kinase [Oscillospiraceae bacterium]
MNLILLGAPGAGKGTQGELISAKLGIPTISTGNMLREAMANGSELGKQVKKYMEEGSLVPDEVIMSIIAQRITEADCKNGFILDGVPRTLAQAEALDAKGIRIDHVVSLEVDDAAITQRMSGRRVCTKCGASYHIVNNPPKSEGICDLCGAEVAIRKDDEPETVLHRLEVYHASTEVLKSYYAGQGKLRLVCGNQPIEDAQQDILKAIGETV